MKKFFGKIVRAVALTGIAAVISFAQSVTSNDGVLKDPRDGKTYKTVKIGDKIWMAENLNFKTAGSMCHGNKNANCKKLGALYKWDDAVSACPAGWHLPTEAEVDSLIAFTSRVTESDVETGYGLKSKKGWKNNLNGDNAVGFNGIPAGYFDGRNNRYESVNNATIFWTSVELNGERARCLGLYDDQMEAAIQQSVKTDGFSVRCVKD